MPIKSRYRHSKRTFVLPIPLDQRRFYTPQTQHCQQLADTLAARVSPNGKVRLRTAAIEHLREHGVLTLGGRWSKHRRPAIVGHFGLLATEWLARSGTVLTDVAVDHLRTFRQPDDPKNPCGPGKPADDAEPLADILPAAPVAPEPTEASWRASELRATQASQREQRAAFIQYLESRKGVVTPKTIYTRWRGRKKRNAHDMGQHGPGRPLYTRIELDMREQLGALAANYLIDAPPIDRHELADKLLRM